MISLRSVKNEYESHELSNIGFIIGSNNLADVMKNYQEQLH